jgi:hypothetical protein
LGFRINMPTLTNEQMQARTKKTLTNEEMQTKLGGTKTAPPKKGGIFSSIAGFARGVAKTPLKAIGTAQTALEAGGQLITGQGDKAAETISKGSERMRATEKALGYGEGEIATPYKIGTDIAEQKEGKGPFGRETLKTIGAGAELASYAMAAPALGTAAKAGFAAKGALGKLALQTASREGIAGAVGGAGMAAQGEDAGVGDIMGGMALGGAMGFVGGAAAPYASKYAGKALEGLKGTKSWLTLSDEAVAKAMQADNKVDVSTPFINRKPAKAGEVALFDKPLNELDDVIHAPPASDAAPVSDGLRKKAKSLGASDSYINNIHEMSHADAVDAREALEMAHFKEKDAFAPDPNRKTGEGLAKVIHALQDARKEAGKALDPSISSLPDVPMALDDVASHVNEWIAEKGIATKVTKKGTKLDFSNSKFAGPSGAADRAAIQEAFDVATTQGRAATMTPKQIRTARQRLRLASEKAAGPASVPFDTETKVLIDGIRSKMDEPLKAMSPEYAQAAMRYAKAMDALQGIYQTLGKDFIGKEEERLTGRLAEILPRLLSNAGERSAMAVDDLLRVAKEVGVFPALLRDPKRMVIFNEGLDNVFDIVPKRSLAGQMNLGIKGNEAVGTIGDVMNRDYVGLADRAYNKVMGEPNTRLRKALRDMLDEKIAQGEARLAKEVPAPPVGPTTGGTKLNPAELNELPLAPPTKATGITPEMISARKERYIADLKALSPGQPETWYEGQAKMSPMFKDPEKYAWQFGEAPKAKAPSPEALKAVEISKKPYTSEQITKAEADLDELMLKAPESKEFVDSLADGLAAKYGGTVAKAPIKGRGRALEKIFGDYGGEASQISDLARNTVVVNDDAGAASVFKELQKHPNLMKGKRLMPGDDEFGYSGVNVKINTPNGVIGEVQANTPDIIFGKEIYAKDILGEATFNKIKKATGLEPAVNHVLYEKARILDLSDAKQLAQYKEYAAQSRAYYDKIRKAWAKLQGGKVLTKNR